MDDRFRILVADRNRHVREFLQRELAADGYRVQVAKDGDEVLNIVDGKDPPDLLILDLEIPSGGALDILDRIHRRTPLLPVVIHSFLTENSGMLGDRNTDAFVEKSENIDRLKAAVADMLKKFYPKRPARLSTSLT
ncbi:MAG: response regulator [Syntrophobacteraceae bacterium]|jgi:CheY-like chemotaxis protein|nr:response regulator [Syntrophobacteraceae bacterium]